MCIDTLTRDAEALAAGLAPAALSSAVGDTRPALDFGRLHVHEGHETFSTINPYLGRSISPIEHLIGCALSDQVERQIKAAGLRPDMVCFEIVRTPEGAELSSQPGGGYTVQNSFEADDDDVTERWFAEFNPEVEKVSDLVFTRVA